MDERVLRAMAATLRHRGPDASGIEALGPAGLAHTRLKVIDLSEAAAQPMSDAGQRIWVSFNGEIYNFQELRRELEGRGHRFRSRSDTEVIVHLYADGGRDALARLDGMFALAVWDQPRQTLVLARDRTGKKPLFYYDHGGVFLFGSELKAILAHPGVDRTIDETVLPLYLRHGYVPTPHTIYRHIAKLPPATTLEVRAEERPHIQCYWRFPADVVDVSIEEAATEVRRLFVAAVERRLVADVPLGLFLSGGVDSTLVAAVIRRELGRPLRTFSIGFDGDVTHDESAEAARVAAELETEHREFRVRAEDLEVFEHLIPHYEEPYADVSAVPTFLISRLARDEVTVALTGDGGDEVFAGYRRFQSTADVERIPAVIREGAGIAARRILPAGRAHAGPWERTRRFVARMDLDLRSRLESWVSMFRPEELEQAWAGTLPSPPLSLMDEVWAHRAGRDVLNDLLVLNARTYLLDDLNPKVDRASMAVGLETRAPFLDTALMEYVFALPGRYKVRNGVSKWILKRAFADILPDEVVRRRKMGFGPPVGAWFRNATAGYLETKITNPAAYVLRHLRPAFVRSMLDAHRSGRRDWGLQLWTLLALELWFERQSSS